LGIAPSKIKNPVTANTKGIIYSAINKHGYSENGAVDECRVNIMDDVCEKTEGD
jgi:hypothetical protein